MSDKPTALLVDSLVSWHDLLYLQELGNEQTPEDRQIMAAFTDLLNDETQLAKIVSTIRAGIVSTVLTYLHEKAQPPD
jgi:hypothetical protein